MGPTSPPNGATMCPCFAQSHPKPCPLRRRITRQLGQIHPNGPPKKRAIDFFRQRLIDLESRIDAKAVEWRGEPKPIKHGQEKSDLFIVAMKPANKPGRLGAELVEPRERTEGNTGEQHTCRTLSRVSVSQRLDRRRGTAWASSLVTQGGSLMRNVFFPLMWCRVRNLCGIRVQNLLKPT
jgi:hypothetical protein